MGSKRKCELCSKLPNIHCGSDQASLCYECDSRVHGANFLVAKHSRALLCHVCQALTPWTGSGPKLGPTISVCQTCLHTNRQGTMLRGDVIDDNVDHEDDDADNEDDDDDQMNEGDEDNGADEADEENIGNHYGDDDDDNQVVPWSYPVSHLR